MKGIIYCRVSSQDQVQGTSLESQQIACAKYARDNGIQIEAVFIEKGESATAANRTEFIKALDFCTKKKDIGAFIVWKLDRFARNTTDHFAVGTKLKQCGTRLHSVTESITDDPHGKLMETLLAGFSEFENETRKQRCISGMQGSLRRGLFIWNSKPGYKRPGKKTKRVMRPDVLDEPQASLIRRGMLLYAEGNTSISELATVSETWGLRTRTGKKFCKRRWSEVLDDIYYAGKVRDPWSKEQYQGQHEGLISMEIFEKIQKVKRGTHKNGNVRQKKNALFPLRDFLRCHTCDKTLTGSSSKGRNGYHPYYHCKNKSCGLYGKSIRKNDLESNFLSFLQTLVPKEEYLDLFKEMIRRTWAEKQESHFQDKSVYENEITALQQRLERITTMRVDGEIDKEQYTKLKLDTELRIAQFTDSIEETISIESDLERRMEISLENITNLPTVWEEADIDQRIKLQKAVLPDGMSYDKGSGLFGTAPLSYLFRLFWDFPMEESVLVAGPGIEPGSGGYEPPEVPLLYPAKYSFGFDLYSGQPREVMRLFARHLSSTPLSSATVPHLT